MDTVARAGALSWSSDMWHRWGI